MTITNALFLHSENFPRNPGFGPGVGVRAGPVTAGIASILPEWELVPWGSVGETSPLDVLYRCPFIRSSSLVSLSLSLSHCHPRSSYI